jgi:hypothetical protein
MLSANEDVMTPFQWKFDGADIGVPVDCALTR